MNRVGLGLAVGAGYVLGRTKKMKLAFAVGTLVAGKRMQLSPKALADVVSKQLLNNPAFKELNDQLRTDLRGVGKAASGALVERQISGLANRLHGRTADVRNQLAGVTPDVPGHHDDEDDAEDRYDDEPEQDEDEHEDETPERESAEEKPRPRKKAPAKKATAKKAPEKQGAARKAPAKKTAAAARKAPAKKTAATKTAARRVPRSRQSEGGRDDG